MISVRVMTYNINGGIGSDHLCQPERAAAVIAASAPDIVALQDVGGNGDSGQLQHLAAELGMRCWGGTQENGVGFLSYYPLSGVREFDLGEGGYCQRADFEKHGQRLHLLNVRLASAAGPRQLQIGTLLGSDFLSSRSLVCPTLICGDFADHWWGAGNFSLAVMLQRAPRPWFSGTYPAQMPLFGRDRGYAYNGLNILDVSIVHSSLTRKASQHLPVIFTLQIADPRLYLRQRKPMKAGRMEIAHG
jgi:endonuclease/exonuclease/phosphatase family metal-dependent hydrolase